MNWLRDEKGRFDSSHRGQRLCFLREGGRHTVYVNPTARKVSTVPRHREINEFMAKKICREFEIDEPGKAKKPEQGEPSNAADSQ